MAAALAMTGVGAVGTGVNLRNASDCRTYANGCQMEARQYEQQQTMLWSRQWALQIDKRQFEQVISGHENQICKYTLASLFP